MRPTSPFRFKQFSIAHHRCAHKVGTDGVLLGAWVQAKNPKTILDVGTGSGLIALMLAQRFPEAKVRGIDLDKPSAEQASENTVNSPFADRVNIISGDFLKHSFVEKFDLIVSNPPFFKGNTSTGKSERDRARHEEHLPQRDFIERAASLLSEEGQLAVVLPKTEALYFMEAAKEFSLFPYRLTKVYGRPGAEDKRWLISFSHTQMKQKETALTLRDEDGIWSKEYRGLTEGFHPGL